MSPVTHQTVRLTRGKHDSPDDGACVMELASMLAGECFSDHPASVCPTIGSFLRAYNDSIDEDRRQDLYAYASKVVGSRACKEVQEARAARLIEWASELQRSRSPRFARGRLRALTLWCQPDDPGQRAVHVIRVHSDETHRKALALIDELLEIGRSERMLDVPGPRRTTTSTPAVQRLRPS